MMGIWVRVGLPGSLHLRSIGKRLPGFHNPDLVIGKGQVSVGQLYLGHMTAHALRLGSRANLRMGQRHGRCRD